MKKLYIARSKNVGRGVFAGENIRKGEKILKFKGRIVKYAYDSNFKLGPRWLGIGKNTWIIINKNNPGDMINHSCNPNAGLKNKIFLIAIKNIKNGEEVTFDYSTSEEDPYWKMNCKCHAKNCRNIIRDFNHLPNKLKQRYKKLKIVPAFILRKL
ncbi:MAG TPA: SET domain-containing protein-lysine N-methyltransferase [Candidatus Nanoarchaeia archaeon]|nr:SET domain-containing protein-lysine N-methyltransferase [Candidatus Nanoarchaeia archaeon]